MAAERPVAPLAAATAVAEAHDAEFTAPSCADCRAPVSGSYCAACGQETHIETPTVGHFLREFIDQYVALEGKLGRTLRVLLVQPGQLTLDYVEGRRQRYVRPLKLYLTISVVFFGLLGVLPDSSNPFMQDLDQHHGAPVRIDLDKDDKPGQAVEAAQKARDEALAEAARDIARETGTAPPAAGSTPADTAAGPAPKAAAESGVRGRIRSKALAFSALSAEEQRRQLREKLADDAPYAMFFLLPYFALLLKWFYRKQKQRYGVHLLFSLHLHSFLFIVLALGFIPLPSVFDLALKLVVGVYVFLALRRVYGGTALRTLWRMAWLWAFYTIAVAASAASGVLSAMLSTGGSA